MPEAFIATLRRQVVDLVRAECSIPVYGYLPDDPAHVPAHVVGRPDIRESDTPAVMTMTLDITVLGRRISDDDSQAELDALADELFNALGCTRGVKVGGDNPRLLCCTTVRPGTVLVAGNEYPAYLFTVTVEIVTC